MMRSTCDFVCRIRVSPDCLSKVRTLSTRSALPFNIGGAGRTGPQGAKAQTFERRKCEMQDFVTFSVTSELVDDQHGGKTPARFWGK